ncbi:MAG: phenylacetyl-CoA:acceptor oxidoreductase [Gammaproteobacteria bacterium]|nr:MAG: phenylacetyl-CoA:acceptor oxidoreductase [Gammaproteobacteria bacterium]
MIRFGSTLQNYWDWRAAGNFIFGGTGSGLLILATLMSWPGPLEPAAGLPAVVLIGLGLFLVWLEIGRPWRFLHVFFHPQTSWMTREGSVAVLLLPLALLAIVFAQGWLLALTGVLAIAFLYCQARILQASKGIPAWREPAVVPLIVISGLTEGTALLFLISAVAGQPQSWTEPLLVILLAARGYAWVRYRAALTAAEAPAEALAALGRFNPLLLGGGNVLPLVLALAATALPTQQLPLMFSAALLALAGGWLSKFVIIRKAAHLQGYAVGRLRRGRPQIRPPVRRKPDRFVS